MLDTRFDHGAEPDVVATYGHRHQCRIRVEEASIKLGELPELLRRSGSIAPHHVDGFRVRASKQLKVDPRVVCKCEGAHVVSCYARGHIDAIGPTAGGSVARVTVRTLSEFARRVDDLRSAVVATPEEPTTVSRRRTLSRRERIPQSDDEV